MTYQQYIDTVELISYGYKRGMYYKIILIQDSQWPQYSYVIEVVFGLN